MTLKKLINRYNSRRTKVNKYLTKSLCLVLGAFVIFLPFYLYEWSASRDRAITNDEDYKDILKMGLIGIGFGLFFFWIAGDSIIDDSVMIIILIGLNYYALKIMPHPFFGT